MSPIMLDCQSLKPKFKETKKLWPKGVELGRKEEEPLDVISNQAFGRFQL